jgi:hypothetical protein
MIRRILFAFIMLTCLSAILMRAAPANTQTRDDAQSFVDRYFPEFRFMVPIDQPSKYCISNLRTDNHCVYRFDDANACMKFANTFRSPIYWDTPDKLRVGHDIICEQVPDDADRRYWHGRPSRAEESRELRDALKDLRPVWHECGPVSVERLQQEIEDLKRELERAAERRKLRELQ